MEGSVFVCVNGGGTRGETALGCFGGDLASIMVVLAR